MTISLGLWRMPDQPNFLIFLTDQQRWDTMGLHGNPMGLTRNLDRLAQRGTHVFNSFSCQPLCGPARACMQTGLYPTTTGCFNNMIPLPAGARTLAHHFREAGYRTAYFGKWHLGSSEPVPEHERGGYEDWLAANVPEFCTAAYDTVLFDGDGHKVRLPGYRTDAFTDAAIRWLDERGKGAQPFFLFLSIVEPHHEVHTGDCPAPEGYAERYNDAWTPPDLAAMVGSAPRHLAGYCGMVRRIDEALGRVMDALKSLGLGDKTNVLFTSDHGCHFRTRNVEYKRTCHESSIRVPTVLAGPGFDGGGRVRELVSLIDLPPTLLDAAGIEIPEIMQGRSILPLLRGKEAAWPDDVFIQTSSLELGRAVRTKRWKYGVLAKDKDPERDMRSDAYEEAFLYDLKNDPYELTNLCGFRSHLEVHGAMRRRLLRRMAEAGEETPEIMPAATLERRTLQVTSEEASA